MRSIGELVGQIERYVRGRYSYGEILENPRKFYITPLELSAIEHVGNEIRSRMMHPTSIIGFQSHQREDLACVALEFDRQGAGMPDIWFPRRGVGWVATNGGELRIIRTDYHWWSFLAGIIERDGDGRIKNLDRLLRDAVSVANHLSEDRFDAWEELFHTAKLK